MKIPRLIFLIICLLPFAAGAQTYSINTSNGQTITTCTGTFLDSGGATGQYSNNENYTVTFCAPTGAINNHIRIFFENAVDIGAPDAICFYDGNSTSAPLLGCYNSDNPLAESGNVEASAANASGCLTIVFTSDASATGGGWSGAISCVRGCQTILSVLNSTNPPRDANGYVNICPGETVLFSGSGAYPQNNIYYNQSDATTSFEWNFGDDVNNQGFGLNASHKYNTPGGYYAELILTDQNGCKNSNRIKLPIRVAPDMEFTGVSASDYQICVGDTITLQASAVPTTAAFLPPSIRSDSLFLPDGTGGSVQTGIGFTQFEPGAVLTNISDLQGICVNMEHSWMRDIEIKIKCPNGTTVTLLNQVTVGGEVFMGIPNETDGGSGSGGAQNPPGTGYTYCWTPNATQGTMLEYANNTGVHDLPDNIDYESYQTLNNLIGCPLNGDWQIIVKDNWGSDNGWVFSWGIDFNPLLFPNLEMFTPAVVSEEWSPNSTFVTNNGHTATVSPQVPGTASYTYVAENEYGCTYDTTINIVVLPANDPQCFSCGQVQITNLTDTTICQGQSVVLSPQSSVGGSQSTFGNSSASAIPDNGFLTNNPLNAQVNVSGLPFTAIANGSIASVCINIDHNNVSDMDIFLISPCGQSLELSTDNGGSGDDYVNACFTPTATQPIAGLTSAATPFNATYLPEGNFSIFNGCNPNGTWTLRVFDDANGISGTLLGFTIVFNTPSTATYTWSPATGLSCTDCPNPTANPSTSTTYIVTVSDANSCSGTADVAVNINTPQSAPVVTCSGSTISSVTFSWLGTGSYEVSLNGGTSWIPANGINSHTVTGLTVGQSVTIEVRQTGGTAICPSPIGTGTCTASLCNLSGNILSITHETCAGDNDGSITLSGTGGTQPYTYTLNSTTQSSGSFNNLPPATYVAIVTDATGCVSTIANNINIIAATVLTASANSTPVSCFGSTDATTTVTPQGGTGAYTYLWNTTPAQTSASATGLAAATYTVTVTDANGCSTTTSTTVSTPTQLGSSVTVTDATCTVGNDGSATVSATGGQIPYTYNWSNGQTGATVSGLSGGAYTVTVRDANGCSTTNVATINQPTSLNVTATAVDVACNSGTDGSISLTITGGNPPLTFNWSSGQSIQDITNLAAGSYTVTVTDGSGCRAVVSASVAEPTQLTMSTSSTPTSCFGSLDGTASVTAQGGTGTYAYVWSSTPAQTGATATGLAATNYTVTVTDANGCSMTATSVVTQPTQMITSMTSTNVLCAGNSDGTATVSTIGGQQPYTYLWNYNAQTSATITNIPTGSYQVTVTDANGCKATHATSIAQPQPLLATVQAMDITCAGAADGNISLTVSDGTAPYTFNWSNGETTQNIQNLNAGTYDVTVTDNNGCIRIITNINLTEPTPLTASSSSTPAACNGGANGTATVIVQGGVTPYTYLWDANASSQTTSTATNLQANTYSITITDNHGCSQVMSVGVGEQSSINHTATAIDTKCFDSSDGSATINATGGTGTLTYQWDASAGSQTTATANNLAAGNYVYSVTDQSGCTSVGNISVGSPTEMNLNMSITPTLCNDSGDGQVEVLASQATPTYTYQWSANANNQTTSIATGLFADTYFVTVTDNNGCIKTAEAIVNEPLLLTATVSPTDVLCFGGNDGTALADPQGGTQPYTYLWSDTQNTQTASGLTAGDYTVTVSDANGCTTIQTATIQTPSEILLTTASTPAACNGGQDGSATVTATDGTPPYTYLWNNGTTTPTNTNLAAGAYTVTVTDANGCPKIASVVVGEQANVVYTTNSTSVSCFGAADGTATVNITGGTGPFTFQWSTGQTATSIAGLTAGNYLFTITDGTGCSAVGDVDVPTPQQLLLDLAPSNVSCNAASTGAISSQLTGGTTPYTYTWSNGATTPNINNIAAGNYTLTIRDANGCTTSATTTVTEPEALQVQLSGTDVHCANGNDGTVSSSAQGGTNPYTYLWSTGDTSQGIGGLTIGTYSLSVTDANGCATTASITLFSPPALVIDNIVSTDALCFNAANGTATVSASGAVPPYTYLWSDGQQQQTQTAIGLVVGSYTVTVTDANLCQTTASVAVGEPIALTTNLSQQATSCYQGNDGTATIEAMGATPPYTYLWSTGESTTTILNLTGGAAYTVTVTDANGCSAISSIVIEQPMPITLTTASVPTLCAGSTDGYAWVQASGGTEPYTYSWDNAANTDTAYNLAARIYTVTVTDAGGCTATASVNVEQPSRIILQTSANNVGCAGQPEGSATVNASGGTPPYSYLWSDDNQTTATADTLYAGNYTVTVTDANSCTATATVQVTEPGIPLTAQATATDVTCYGYSDGRVEVYGSGGTPPYEYSTDGQNYNGSNFIVGLTAKNHTIYTRDVNGCVYTLDILVNEPAELTVDAGADQTIEFGDSALILAATNQTGNYTYVWSSFGPDNISCDSCEMTYVLPADLQMYSVQVTNLNGCTATDDVRIYVEDIRRVFVATGFTPNADNSNDYLLVQGGRGTVRIKTFRVYDRWGTLVFETADAPLNDINYAWDGNFKGKPLNADVFAWYTEVEFTDGEVIAYKGNTTLIR